MVLPSWGALSLATAGCDQAEPPPPTPPEVVVSEVVQQDVPIYGTWVGSVEGLINAQIRSQVQGYLLKRHYKEGSFVQTGDLLFEIDAREFRADLDRARGQLGEAKAMLGKSLLDVERYTPLAIEGAVSQQELDDAIQAKLRDEATVAKARAEVRRAQLDLGWTKITSPIDGIAGIAVAQIGDLVAPTSELTTVSQLDPIKVQFPISEQEYLMYDQETERMKFTDLPQSEVVRRRHRDYLFGNGEMTGRAKEIPPIALLFPLLAVPSDPSRFAERYHRKSA